MALPVSWKPLVKSNASAVMTTMIKRNKLMFTGLILVVGIFALSNREAGESQVYGDSSPDVTCR